MNGGATLAAMESELRNVRFGVARGLTQLARLAAQTVTSDMPATFDRPTPFTQKGVAFLPATRDTLLATVFVKDAQAAYLEIEETGGERLPRRGNPINLPVNLTTNAYGNIPRGKISQVLSRKSVFLARGTGKTAHLPPGIYQRNAAGKRRDGSKGTKGALRKAGVGKAMGGSAARGFAPLELLVGFGKQAHYRPRFQFRRTVEGVVAAQGPAVIAASVADALATAR